MDFLDSGFGLAWPGPALAISGIWGVNQWITDLFLSLSLIVVTFSRGIIAERGNKGDFGSICNVVS